MRGMGLRCLSGSDPPAGVSEGGGAPDERPLSSTTPVGAFILDSSSISSLYSHLGQPSPSTPNLSPPIPAHSPPCTSTNRSSPTHSQQHTLPLQPSLIPHLIPSPPSKLSFLKWGKSAGPSGANGAGGGANGNGGDKREWHQEVQGEKYFGLENVSTFTAALVSTASCCRCTRTEGLTSAEGAARATKLTTCLGDGHSLVTHGKLIRTRRP